MNQNRLNSTSSLPSALLAALMSLIFAACAGGGNSDSAKSSDFSRSIYTPKYASGFSIDGADGHESILITICNPWQGADNVEQKLLILRGDENVPEGFAGQVIKGEAKRIVCMSSTQTAMLEAIGEEGRIVGVSGIDFISSEKIKNRKGEIADVGYDGNVDYEKLMAARPDIVLLYGVDSPSAMEPKLKELKIPYIYLGDYLEQSPLAKAEWVRVIGEIAGRGAEAEAVFDILPNQYEEMKAKVAEAIAQKGGVRPKVMMNSPYRDTWYVPSADSYLVRLISDGGGDYICREEVRGNASQIVDMEKAYLLASQADFWMNIGGSMKGIEDLKRRLPKFANVKAVREGKVYDCDKRSTSGGGNDFYESGIMHPDVILGDIAAILHPGAVGADTLTYYRRLE